MGQYDCHSKWDGIFVILRGGGGDYHAKMD